MGRILDPNLTTNLRCAGHGKAVSHVEQARTELRHRCGSSPRIGWTGELAQETLKLVPQLGIRRLLAGWPLGADGERGQYSALMGRGDRQAASNTHQLCRQRLGRRRPRRPLRSSRPCTLPRTLGVITAPACPTPRIQFRSAPCVNAAPAHARPGSHRQGRQARPGNPARSKNPVHSRPESPETLAPPHD